MNTFLEVFALFLLGTCSVVSSPVPTGWGKRIVLFILGVALWAGAIILVRSQEEILLGFLFSDWALSGKLANQVVASLVVFGFGWYVFIVSSFRMERKHTTQFDRLWYDIEPKAEVRKVFRPWPSLLIWVPVVALLAGIWIVPLRLDNVGSELSTSPTTTAAAIATTVPTSTPTQRAKPTDTPNPTSTPTATPEPTVTPTASPTLSPTQTPDPNKPALSCNGTWLHQEPFFLGHGRSFVELCENGFTFAIHDIDVGWDPIPTDSMLLMSSDGSRIDMKIVKGELLVNGQPFAEWLASQGGR